MTQLHALEQFLADDNNLSAISLYLARYIDSTSIENSVRKLLTKIITNNLAQKFSFQGRKSKLKFESALLQYFKNDLMAVADKIVGSWLANAKWRQQVNGSSLRN
ncbi:hypothetical protein PUN28_010882 [Cardiocondyla obscurior]